MACGSLISVGTTLPCAYSMEGTPEELYLGNFSELDKTGAVITSGTDVITTLALTSGAKLYQIGADRKTLTSIGTAYKTVDFRGGDGHTITFFMPRISSDERNFLNSLTRATVYAIVKNKSGNYYVYGYDEGLELTERSWNLSENGGAVSVTIATAESNVESMMKYKLEYDDGTIVDTKSFIASKL